MTMRPGPRRAALVLHVGCSVGWLGAVASSLVVAVAGLAGRDYTRTLDDLARAATTAPTDQLRDPSPVVHGVAAVVLLLAALVLSVRKPRGLTAYGMRRRM